MASKKRTCLVYCGRIGDGFRSNRKYCSALCSSRRPAAKARKARRVADQRANAAPCGGCGRLRVNPIGSLGVCKGCSNRLRLQKPTPCSGCGQLLARRDGHVVRMCQECADKAQIALAAEKQRLRDEQIAEQERRVASSICQWCQQSFVAARMGRRYCSKRCQSTANTRQKKARRRGASGTLPSLWAIYARDGGICQLCRKKVNRSIQPPHSRSASLDHIVPLAVGGSHDSINIQLAHFGCNSAKGARACGSQLRMIA